MKERSWKTERKETFFLDSFSVLSVGFIKAKAMRPKLLHAIKIREFVTRLNPVKKMAMGTTPRLAARNMKEPTRPRFSISVESAKYDKAEGIPKPSETPRRRLEIERLTIERSLVRASESGLTAPNIIQK